MFHNKRPRVARKPLGLFLPAVWLSKAGAYRMPSFPGRGRFSEGVFYSRKSWVIPPEEKIDYYGFTVMMIIALDVKFKIITRSHKDE
jgi:hypothetical protein